MYLPISTPWNLTHSCSATVTLRHLGVKWLSEAIITRRVSMFILITYPQIIRMIDWCLPLKAKMISYFLKRSFYEVKTSNEINILKSCWPAYALVKLSYLSVTLFFEHPKQTSLVSHAHVKKYRGTNIHGRCVLSSNILEENLGMWEEAK